MLLSEQELRNALEPLLDRLLVERFKYFQLQLEARLQSMMDAARAEAPAAASAGELNAGLERLLKATDPNQVFEGLFAGSAELAGEVRALLVRYEETITVWRQEGLELPERFTATEQSTVLKAGAGRTSGTHPVRVRGQIVGMLHWQAAEAPTADRLQQLDLMLHAAGLALLGWGLAEAGMPERQTGRQEPSAAVSEEQERAQAFARVLAEDLELYLRRERRADIGEAGRLEDAWERFQPELERCRRFYLERYPNEAAIGEEVCREAIAKLQARRPPLAI